MPTVPSRGSTEMATLHAPRRRTCLDRPRLSTPAAPYAHRKAPVQEGESMRSGPQTSSAVTTRLPRPRTDTVVLMMSSRNPLTAKEAAQSRHRRRRPPKTCRHTHTHKQTPTTTALHPQSRPPPLTHSSTVAQIHPQLRQHRTLPLLTLQHQPHQTRDSARLLHRLFMLHLHRTHTPNLDLSFSRPPTLQRLLLCPPLWHKKCPSLRARPQPKPPERQDRPQNPSPPPPTLRLLLHLQPQLPPSPSPVVWRAPQSLMPQFLALPLWVGG